MVPSVTTIVPSEASDGAATEAAAVSSEPLDGAATEAAAVSSEPLDGAATVVSSDSGFSAVAVFFGASDDAAATVSSDHSAGVVVAVPFGPSAEEEEEAEAGAGADPSVVAAGGTIAVDVVSTADPGADSSLASLEGWTVIVASSVNGQYVVYTVVPSVTTATPVEVVTSEQTSLAQDVKVISVVE